MVRRIVALLLIKFLAGCATYKVYPDGNLLPAADAKDVSIKKVNEWPEGLHCFEPLFYVLSLGLIPTHCVNTYDVTVENAELGTVKVTSMQGWVTFLMIPFPAWKFGYGNETDVLDNVKDIVISKK